MYTKYAVAPGRLCHFRDFGTRKLFYQEESFKIFFGQASVEMGGKGVYLFSPP
jgi:hypothetical protein